MSNNGKTPHPAGTAAPNGASQPPPPRQAGNPAKPAKPAAAPASADGRPAPPQGPRRPLISQTPPRTLNELADISNRAGLSLPDPELANAVGFTHFDTSSSDDNVLTVLMTRDDLPRLASQTLVRVKSREDKRDYLGVVVRGPFAEPNAVPANSTMAVGVITHGKKLTYTFEYHGRAEVELLGQEVDGVLQPPRFRPRPQSPVFVLSEEESAKVLGVGGALSLGRVVGYDNMEARLNPRDKAILPRHTGIIGTTGGGKSTTVATLIHRAQLSGIATIVFDVEGEYTHVDKPTDHEAMRELLKQRKQKPEGVKDLHIHHLTGRDSRNPRHPHRHGFSLKFSSLSPYAISEILSMSDAQHERFLRAFDVTKLLLEDFKLFPRNEAERQQVLELDEQDTGYPRMTIDHILDVVNAYTYSLSSEGRTEPRAAAGRRRRTEEDDSDGEDGDSEELPNVPRGLTLLSEFKANVKLVRARVMAQRSTHESSWKTLGNKLQLLKRLKVFDVENTAGVNYDSMLQAGRVSVIDLSNTDSPQLNNLVIADILRGLQEHQEKRYQEAAERDAPVTPVLIIIEEAHEFLSANRIKQMPVLFEQVARIAKRGRKRWLGLVFVTQLPQHLPDEVLALLNNFIIHKITDGAVINRMQKSVGSIDESLWNRVSRLAPGQALVSFSNFTRPLMVAVDPAPVKRLLVD
ncbi:ATP-binding protein [Corallococcus exiguus]|uniref:ATP-binding protein n=1 Tax=Corallococcus exiguus TaxID=83462 RepID=UPI0015608787|nr:ATP-binding protein [Corallococcus exiguus]NRD58832.1 ATP-binding protein [Corallococcus exiguus]